MCDYSFFSFVFDFDLIGFYLFGALKDELPSFINLYSWKMLLFFLFPILNPSV